MDIIALYEHAKANGWLPLSDMAYLTKEGNIVEVRHITSKKAQVSQVKPGTWKE